MIQLAVVTTQTPDWLAEGLGVEEKVDDAVDELTRRLSEQGGGLGARMNTLAVERSFLEARAVTTLNWPRTTGRSLREHAAETFEAEWRGVVEDKVMEPLRREWSE